MSLRNGDFCSQKGDIYKENSKILIASRPCETLSGTVGIQNDNMDCETRSSNLVKNPRWCVDEDTKFQLDVFNDHCFKATAVFLSIPPIYVLYRVTHHTYFVTWRHRRDLMRRG